MIPYDRFLEQLKLGQVEEVKAQLEDICEAYIENTLQPETISGYIWAVNANWMQILCDADVKGQDAYHFRKKFLKTAS